MEIIQLINTWKLDYIYSEQPARPSLSSNF